MWTAAEATQNYVILIDGLTATDSFPWRKSLPASPSGSPHRTYDTLGKLAYHRLESRGKDYIGERVAS